MRRKTRSKGRPWQEAARPRLLVGRGAFANGSRRPGLRFLQQNRGFPPMQKARAAARALRLKHRLACARPLQSNQATFLKVLVMLSLIGSTVSVVTFWASAVSSLPCAL